MQTKKTDLMFYKAFCKFLLSDAFIWLDGWLTKLNLSELSKYNVVSCKTGGLESFTCDQEGLLYECEMRRHSTRNCRL